MSVSIHDFAQSVSLSRSLNLVTKLRIKYNVTRIMVARKMGGCETNLEHKNRGRITNYIDAAYSVYIYLCVYRSFSLFLHRENKQFGHTIRTKKMIERSKVRRQFRGMGWL